MIRAHRSPLDRAASLAVACSLALALPVAARASEPELAPPMAVDEGGQLPPQAQRHVVKAIQQFNSHGYSNAEAEFRRAAFFAPNWRPLHFNLGVLAEAQGKLGTAISEYKQFKSVAFPGEAMLVEQRIVELDDRRRRIAGAYKRQIGVMATMLTIGAGMAGTGVALFVIGLKTPKTKTAMIDVDDDNDPATASDSDSPPDTSKKRGNFVTAGYLVGLVGFIVLFSSFVPLGKAIKSKRQLEGLALGPTRLKLNGGGVTLRF